MFIVGRGQLAVDHILVNHFFLYNPLFPRDIILLYYPVYLTGKEVIKGVTE